MVFTNINKEFDAEFLSNLKNCKDIYIVSGYVGITKLKDYEQELIRISKSGECKLLFGMLHTDGVTQYKDNLLRSIDKKLNLNSGVNGVYLSQHPLHAKIYIFRDNDNKEKVYVGSSNFSEQGFSYNYELNVLIRDKKTKDNVIKFVFDLFQNSDVIKLDKSKLRIVKSSAKRSVITKSKKTSNVGKVNNKSMLNKTLSDLLISPKQFPNYTKTKNKVRIKIRPDQQQTSCVNVYFAKGRPRLSWYEVDVTSEAHERTHPDYPYGDFIAYYKDGNSHYKLNMATQSNLNKRISVKGNGKILGEVIKGALENFGILQPNDRITSKMLKLYGNDTITLTKIKDKTYILEF